MPDAKSADLTVKLYPLEGGEPSDLRLSERLFGAEIHKDLLYRAWRALHAHQRQGTHSTKTRGEVIGSGKKPWPQKHTGRARHGHVRSPIWRKGGVTFGPKPRDYDYGLPKQMRRRALQSALIAKLRERQLHALDRLRFEVPKTKAGAALLQRLPFAQPGEDRRPSVVMVVSAEEYTRPVKKTFSNLPQVRCLASAALSVYDVLKHEHLLITQTALTELENRVLGS